MELSREAVSEAIFNYIREEILPGNPDAVAIDTPLLASGILDSISALQMVDFLEKKFSIEFQAHEVDQDNLSSIETLTSFVLSKMNN